MKSKLYIIVLLFAVTGMVSVPAVLCQEKLIFEDEEEKTNAVMSYYKLAIEAYQRGDYKKAIEYWTGIVEIDPDQRQPGKLIKDAEKKIKKKAGKFYKDAMKNYKNGEYSLAVEKLNQVVKIGMDSERIRKVLNKLLKVTEIIKEEKGKGEVSGFIRSGISDYVNNDIKTAINKFRYVYGIQKENEKARRIKSFIEAEYPEIAREDIITPGMDIIEWKLFVALNDIYKGRYDLAVGHCEEILQLEPDNVTAQMRMGSAYFALNEKSKAKKVWKKALKLDPNNETLRKFLKLPEKD